jgi:hypothetical protein
MSRRIAAAAATAGLIAVAVGCSSSPASPAATATAAAAASTSPAAREAATLTCKQQYTAWKYGPARPVGKKLTKALNAIQAAGDAEDIPELNSALKKAGRDADALRRYPMPACADPHGYWDKSLARIKAAGDNAASGSGLGGLLMAEAPLKDVPGIEAKLEAELKARHLT